MGNGNQRIRRRLIGAVALLLSLTSAAQACTERAVSLRGDWGQARFAVEVADDRAERAQGLMNVPAMPLMNGMLFVYERPQRTSFWMRNTLIPLDMIFADEQGVIRTIHPMAVPLDETPIFGGDDIQYVLEINGGLAERLGLQVGDQMQHPAIGEMAAWPCGAD